MEKKAPNLLGESGGGGDFVYQHQWQEVKEALHSNDYERLADFLSRALTFAENTYLPGLINLASQLCIEFRIPLSGKFHKSIAPGECLHFPKITSGTNPVQSLIQIPLHTEVEDLDLNNWLQVTLINPARNIYDGFSF